MGMNQGQHALSRLNNKFPCGASCSPIWKMIKTFMTKNPIIGKFLKLRKPIKKVHMQTTSIVYNYYLDMDETQVTADTFGFLVGKLPDIKIWLIVGKLDSFVSIERCDYIWNHISGKVWKSKQKF